MVASIVPLKLLFDDSNLSNKSGHRKTWEKSQAMTCSYCPLRSAQGRYATHVIALKP